MQETLDTRIGERQSEAVKNVHGIRTKLVSKWEQNMLFTKS